MKEAWNHFPTQINLSEYDNLQFVKVKKGTSVQVHADANPSTGYNLTTALQDDCSVSLTTGSYNANDTGMVGASGIQTYEIKGNSLGSCLVEFQQTPPGEDLPTVRKAIYFIVE